MIGISILHICNSIMQLFSDHLPDVSPCLFKVMLHVENQFVLADFKVSFSSSTSSLSVLLGTYLHHHL